MKLEFAILANAASVAPNGLISMIDGGLEWLTAPSFPATQPSMTLVARIVFLPEECGRKYVLRTRIVAPTGDTLDPSIEVPFEAKRHAKFPKDKSASTTFALTFLNVRFPAPGEYAIRIAIDRKKVGRFVFEAVQEKRSKQSSGG